MLKPPYRKFGGGLLLLAILLVFECSISWFAFCNPVQNQRSAYQAAEENICVFRGPLFSLVRFIIEWWQRFFDNPDAYVALFTAVLSASTIALWFSTKRSASIAERALIELEAPFIGLQIVESGLGARWKSKDHCHIEKTWNGLTFGFVNYGRTAAALLELRDKLQICAKGKMPTLEWSADRKKSYPYGVLVGPDKTSAESSRLFDNFIDKIGFLTFSEGDSDLFLVGRLKYRDIFTGTFEMGFCAVFNRETSRFLIKGDEKYNYCRRS
jgi:hypothetical protein